MPSESDNRKVNAEVRILIRPPSEERSRNMAAVRTTDTDIEVLLRRALWGAGLRYRLKSKLPGRPDIVFPGKKVAIFCDGCFWHGCPRCAEVPKTNRRFWSDKIGGNRLRDLQVTEKLSDLGWTVLRYWGCEIQSDLPTIVREVKATIYGIWDETEI